MKKFLKGVVVFIVTLLTAPFILHAVLSAASFAYFYVSLSRTNTDACIQYYEGVGKGTIWSRGEWHHYVDFKVDNSSTHKYWKVVEAPLPSSIWKSDLISPDTMRASYRWPSNWPDPFPVSAWKLCASNSRHIH
jgi:hypothetical protein